MTTPSDRRNRARDPRAGAPISSARISGSTLGLATAIVIVIVGVLLFRDNGIGTRPSPSPDASQAASASPATTESASATAGAEPSASPTIVPQATLTGDVPGPDATVPPGVPVIPGLRIEVLVNLLTSIGLSCESHYGGYPGAESGYNVYCVRVDVAANTQYSAEAIYWTSTGVNKVSLDITSISGESIDGTPAAARLFLPIVDLASGPAARDWAEDRLGQTTCNRECTDVTSAAKVLLTVGRLGGHQLYLIAQAPSGS